MKDGKYVVLYVDDDQDFLDSTSIVLEASGYHVLTAESAEEGFRVFKENKPDLIIVDLIMEKVDAGTGLAKDLKLANNTAPVYLLSSVGDQLHTIADYNELGLCGIFQKPVNFDNLIKTIKTKLGQ